MDEDYVRDLRAQRDQIAAIGKRNERIFTWLIVAMTMGATALIGYWWCQ